MYMFIVQIPQELSRLYIYTLGISTPFYDLSSFFTTVLLASITHFLFHQVPITAGWTDTAWSEKFP